MAGLCHLLILFISLQCERIEFKSFQLICNLEEFLNVETILEVLDYNYANVLCCKQMSQYRRYSVALWPWLNAAARVRVKTDSNRW